MHQSSSTNARQCEQCDQTYSPEEQLVQPSAYWAAPYHYDQGADRYCLSCWLELSGMPATVRSIDMDHRS